jgi:hypothetical protein
MLLFGEFENKNKKNDWLSLNMDLIGRGLMKQQQKKIFKKSRVGA